MTFDPQMPHEPAASFIVRPVDGFPEPDFSRLQRRVFAAIQQNSPAIETALREEAAGRPELPALPHAPMFRFGAYVADELIGWSCGWMERGDVCYMANSGVVERHRRRGVYAALLAAVRDHALAQGATMLRSQHNVLNNPVLIAKLRAGFHVSGLSQAAQMGTLVELTLHLFPTRQAIYAERSLPRFAPAADPGD